MKIKEIEKRELRRSRKTRLCVMALSIAAIILNLVFSVWTSKIIERYEGQGISVVQTSVFLLLLFVSINFISLYSLKTGKQKFVYGLTNRIYEHNLFGDYEKIEKRNLEEDFQVIQSQCEEIGEYYYTVIPKLIADAVLGIGMIWLVYSIRSPKLSLMVGVILVLVCILQVLCQRKINEKQKVLSEAQNRFFAELLHIIESVYMIKARMQFDKTEKRIEDRAYKLIYKSFKVHRLEFVRKAGILFLQYATIFAGLLLFLDKELSIAQYVILEQYIYLFIGEFENFWSMISKLGRKKNAEGFIEKCLEEKNQTGELCVQDISDIVLDKVEFNYSTKSIFNGLSYSFTKGNCYLIEGKNGTGKTTLITILLGLRKITGGDIFINGQSLSELNRKEYLRNNVVYMPQKPAFMSNSWKDNLKDYGEGEIKAETIALRNQLFTTDMDLLENWNKELSGGQMQKVAFLQLLNKSNGGQLLILDEPTNMMDMQGIQSMLDLIQKLKKDNIVLVISHDNKVKEVADHILRIGENGCLM